MEYMAGLDDNAFDLAIVDPPYGIGMGGGADWGTNTKTFHKHKDWDNEIPTKEYFNELFRVSKFQIIWGGNYFIDYLTNTKSFIVWDKMNGGNNMASCELAWTSHNKPIKKISLHIFSGIGNTYYRSIHPTQKPIRLYDWVLQNYAKPEMGILDTHLGSGSSAIAAHYFGCDFVGCEIDKDYFEAAQKRFDKETRQIDFKFE